MDSSITATLLAAIFSAVRIFPEEKGGDGGACFGFFLGGSSAGVPSMSNLKSALGKDSLFLPPNFRFRASFRLRFAPMIANSEAEQEKALKL